MRVDLFFVPGSVSEERLTDKTLVMIDVLRASTTICQSLKSGAKAVIPVERPGEAVELRTRIGVEDAILGGERESIKIENFDLGNSPLEYSEAKVKGKTVILTTSNGTQNYLKANVSSPVITCGLVNISRVTRKVTELNKDLVILCSGQGGDFSLEDTLCGGMLIYKLMNEEKVKSVLNDAASLALLLYRENSGSLKEAIAGGEHGRYLAELGFSTDVDTACELDSIPVLPVLKDRRIVLNET